jgi:aspartate/methionine/tyrosine aminotransferase
MLRDTVAPFYAIDIARLAYAREQAGLPVIHMEVGQPSCGAPKAAITTAQHVLANDPLGYWESSTLKARIAEQYANWYGLKISTEQIIITTGASGALVLAFTLLFQPGDRVALGVPGYPAYRNTLNALHLKPVELRCGPATGYQPTGAMIRALDPAPQGVVVASPANPTGAMIDSEGYAALADACNSHQAHLISDEIYHGISYGRRCVCALEINPNAIVINSFSKYYAMPGWRLGWMIVPEKLAEAFNRYSGNLYLAPPTLAQHAALAAMDCQQELQQNLATYVANRALLLERLPKLDITDLAPADGAFYVYANVSHITNDALQFCKDLLADTGVAIAPGLDFDPQEGHRYIRFSFAVSTAECRTALMLFEDWLADRIGT